MDIDFEVIDQNLNVCWSYYKDYIYEMRQQHYSDYECDNFNAFCSNELFICPNCKEIKRYDYQEKYDEPTNTDNVCDDCIEEMGYYE